MTNYWPAWVRSIAFAKLAKMIADSQVFQDQCRLDNSEDASKHVKYPWFRDELQSLRPYALIQHPKGGGSIAAYKVASGGRNEFLYRGSMTLWLADEIRDVSEAAALEEITQFTNFADGVIAHLLELAGADDNLPIIAIAETAEPARTDPRMVAGVAVTRPTWISEYLISWDAAG